MPFEYKKGTGLYDREVDPKLCKASVHEPGRGAPIHQCQRRPVRDGWCGQHHPEAEAKRVAAAHKRYQEQYKTSVWGALERAKQEIAALKTRLRKYEPVD